MFDDIEEYYAELDRRMGLPPTKFQEANTSFDASNKNKHLYACILSSSSALDTKQSASFTREDPVAPSLSTEAIPATNLLGVDNHETSPVQEDQLRDPSSSFQTASSTKLPSNERNDPFSNRKRSSSEGSETAPIKKRRIDSEHPPSFESDIEDISIRVPSDLRQDLTANCSSSPTEDISMFPDEESMFVVPKPGDSHTSGPLSRQPAAEVLLPYKPDISDNIPESDGLEDISMYTEDSPMKVPDSTSSTSGSSKKTVKAQQKTSEVPNQVTKSKAPKTTAKSKVSAKRPAFTAVKDYILSTRGTPSGPVNFLKGKHIFYVGKDGNYISQGTKNKIDLIIKHGGAVQDAFDPATTSIVITDTDKNTTARACGLKKITDIPMHIPTVKWSWMQGPMGNRSVQRRISTLGQDATFGDLLEEPWKHVAFAVRKKAGDQEFWEMRERLKAKAAARALSLKAKPANVTRQPSDSSVSEQSQGNFQPVASTSTVAPAPAPPLPLPQMPGLPLSPPASPPPAKIKEQKETDPLEEFYERARRDVECGYELDDSAQEKVSPAFRAPARGWQCDGKPPDPGVSPNQDIVDKLEELRRLHSNKVGEDNRWRAYTYQKLIPILKAFPRRITCKEDIESIKGIGDKTVQKVMEIVNTGNLKRIDYERTEDVKCMAIFQGIYGVGQSTALEWYQAGCRTLDDIRARKGGISLNSVQQIGLEYYDDINERIPRTEVEAIFDIIKPLALKLDPKLSVEVMGSFRRGKASCGDVDILITRPTDDGRTHSGIMERLLHTLHSNGVLTEDLSLPGELEDLECTYRGLCRLPSVRDSKRRRIDILCVPWSSRGAALLYYTGDDIFNRSMRLKANKMGYSLNQRGLFAGIVRDPTNRMKKLNEGSIIASETEEEIFKILEVPWQEPHERARS